MISRNLAVLATAVCLFGATAEAAFDPDNLAGKHLGKAQEKLTEHGFKLVSSVANTGPNRAAQYWSDGDDCAVLGIDMSSRVVTNVEMLPERDCKDARARSKQAAKAAPSGEVAEGGVAMQDMGRYCQGEAAQKFGQRPQDILTLPVERDHGMYSVYGQYPPEGSDVTTFICTFDAQGKLVGVDKD